MASITSFDTDGRRVLKGSKARPVRFVARWRTPEGLSREKWFAKKVDAVRHLTSVEHRKMTGEYIDASAGRVTFEKYAAAWLERKRGTTKSTTTGPFASHLRVHLTPAFGRLELRAITREHVKAFAASLETAPTTSRAIMRTLTAVLAEAVDDGRIVRNPALRLRVGTTADRRVDPMHIAGVALKVPALADAMPGRCRAAVMLMASTGLRLGECLGLSVDHVGFLRRTISVDRQLSTEIAAGLFTTPKTKASVRTIPVPSHVTDMLAAHLAEHPAGEHGLIFTTEAGRPLVRSVWSELYRAACQSAGLDRSRTHDLRHVAASSLIASGLSVAAVQAVLGHSSPAETLGVYTHLWPSDEERTREAIERASAVWLTAQ